MFRPTVPTIETESTELIPQISDKELIPERVTEFTYYLKNRVVQMKAGCIANQLSEWEKITSDPETLSTVSGLPLDFSEEIDYISSVSPSKFSPKEEMFLSVEIKKTSS